MSTFNNHPPSSLRLLAVLLAGLALSDVCLFVMIRDRIIESEMFFLGWVLGQAGFMCVLAGGVGRAWVASFLAVAAISTLSLLMLPLIAYWRYGDSNDNSWSLIVAATSPILYCGSQPFWLVRLIWGYRIDRQSQTSTTGRSLTMEDMLAATTVLAAMIVPIPALFGMDGVPDGEAFAWMTTIGLISFLVGLFIVLPASIGYLTIRRVWKRLLVLCGLCMGVPFGTVIALSYVRQAPLGFNVFYEIAVPLLVAATGCFAICLVVLKATQLSWVRDQKAIALQTGSALDEDEPTPVAQPRRWPNRVAAAVIVVCSILQVIAYDAIGKRRAFLESRLTALANDWRSKDGYVNYYRYRLNGFRAPRDASAVDIQFLLESKAANSAELAGTRVTDEMFLKAGWQPRLQSIDLTHTLIGDRTLDCLRGSSDLKSIKVGYTRVTAGGLERFLRGRSCNTLHLSGLGLTDADIARLPLESFLFLDVKDNPLTGAAGPQLKHAIYLDLSGTQFDGQYLTTFNSIKQLRLDNTAVNDEHLRAFLEQQPLAHGLSLRGTQVTDAILPGLKKFSLICLDSRSITQQGIIDSGIMPSHLALNGPKFDPSIFLKRSWGIDHLDLRSSSTSDANLQGLANLKTLSALSLEGCDVSDASLPWLSTLPLTSLDLSRTKVTGLQAARQLPNCIVHVSAEQCDSELLRSLNLYRNLRVGSTLETEPLPGN